MGLTFNHALELLGKIVLMEEHIGDLTIQYDNCIESDELEAFRENVSTFGKRILSGSVNLELDCTRAINFLDLFTEEAGRNCYQTIFLDANKVRADLVELGLEIKRLNKL